MTLIHAIATRFNLNEEELLEEFKKHTVYVTYWGDCSSDDKGIGGVFFTEDAAQQNAEDLRDGVEEDWADYTPYRINL